MKKIIFALVVSSILAQAADTTVKETMSLMTQGMNRIQTGILYTKKEDIVEGIKVLENANAIFTRVDVSKFIPNNGKVQVTKNISKHLTADLKVLKKAIKSGNYTDATNDYGRVLANCVACHKIVRGW